LVLVYQLTCEERTQFSPPIQVHVLAQHFDVQETQNVFSTTALRSATRQHVPLMRCSRYARPNASHPAKRGNRLVTRVADHRNVNAGLDSYVTMGTDQPTCAVVDIGCLPGFHCEDTLTGIRCAPNKEHKPFIPLQPPHCDLICISGTHCELVKGKPECVMDEALRSGSKYQCVGVECPAGEYCELFDNAPKCVPLPGEFL
ncbi:hypothetical protein COOONC_12427, partial [Cooperia oncophora]